MEDNEIRIPSRDYLQSAGEALKQLYACYQHPENCPTPSPEPLEDQALLLYQKAVVDMEQLMAGFPVAADKPLYPVSYFSQKYLSGRQISRQTAGVLFDDLRVTFQASCREGIESLLPRLHDAVYWAGRGNYQPEEIQEELSSISSGLKECFQKPKDQPEIIADKPKSPSPALLPAREESPPSPRPRLFPSLTPLVVYEGSQSRSYIGTGVGGEILIPFDRSKPWVIGGEAQLLFKVGFDQPALFNGEVKDVYGAFFPLFLEAGYHGDRASVLLQVGGWLTRQPSDVRAGDVYSANILENGTFRVGLKTYFIDNHLVLAGGFQQNPWGPGGYVSMGIRFGN